MNKKELIKKAQYLLRLLPDKLYLQLYYFAKFKKFIDFKNPQTFNEKLQWAKLYDRKEEYTVMADKYQVKQYVSHIIGEEYVVPGLGLWQRFEDIDFDKLPDQFVLKCTHDSGGLVICRDKSKMDIDYVKKKINSSLKTNYFYIGREWPYKNIKPMIMAEKYLEDSRHGDEKNLTVYKFFCFDGEPYIIQLIQNDKQKDETVDYFDISWNRLNLKQSFPNSEQPMKKPENLEELLHVARKLSQEKTGFIRVDLYSINNKIYFSEYTFFTDNGMAVFEPKFWDKKLGAMLDLQHDNMKF